MKVINSKIVNGKKMFLIEESIKKLGGVIEDNQGQWKYPGQITKINSPNITMKGVNYPVLGISEQTGEQKLMFPENNYKFKSTKAVIEIPFSNKPYFFNGGVVEESVTEYPIIQKNRKIITQNGKLIKKENVDSTFTKNYFQQGGMTKSKYKPSVEKSLFSDNYLYNEETSKKLKNDLEYLLSSNQDIKNINGYKIGKAKDEQGEYYSFYKLIKKNFGKNDEYYDRVYVKDLKLKNYEEGDIAKEKYYPNESKGLNLKEESNFVFDWLNSSKAKDIAKKRGIDLKERIDRLKNTNLFLLESDEYNQAVPYLGNSSSGAFDTEKGYVYLDKDKNKKYSGVHELNHASTNANEFLPKKDIEDIQNKIFTNDKYLKDPTEVQARINVTRKYLKDLKIYDPLIEDFTKEHLKKLKKYIKNNYNIIESNASDLLNISKSDEDLIWLMNNIVYQDNHQNDNKTQLAQAGTTVKINKDNVVKEYDRRSPEYKAMYDSGRLMSYDKSTDTYRATPLETFEVKTKAPQWLIDKRNIEKNFTKEKFVKKYLPKWSGSMGETADNLSENAQKDYDKKVNDKLANVLLKSNQKKGNKEANNLDWYNSFSEKEREIIQQSSFANKFAPAQRAYDLDVSNSTKKYNTTDVLTDADKLSQSVQGTPERFRLFPNAENNIESYVNPGMFLGSMAKGLGNVPKDIKNENYGQAALSIATPLGVGALAGIGNPNTGQFVNNIVNPFAGTGDLVNNLGNKYLPNAYKLNPYAFKPNSEMMYRGIGKEGMEDALESGVFRAKQNVAPIMDETGRFDMFKQFQGTYYSPKFNTADQYGAGYIAEVPKDVTNFRLRYKGKGNKTWSQIADENIPIDKGKILKKDWLQGYKPIEIPKSNFKSEIDWAKWNKEIPENTQLMKEYSAIEQQTKANNTWMKNPDGTDFPGTPELFVQQNSSNFKNAFGNTKVLVNGRPQILTHNSPDIFSEFSLNKVNNGRLSGDGVYTFEEGALWKGMPEYLKQSFRYPAKIDQSKYGNIEYHLYGNSTNPKIGKGQFDDISKDIVIGSPTSTRVIDDINRKNIHIFPNINQLKSAIGNNGMFDMTNPNIYKTLVGGLAIGTLGKQAMEKKEFGGKILNTKIENGKKYFLINE